MLSGTFASAKPIKEFDSVQLLEIEKEPNRWNLYLVAGANRIFLLGPDSGDDWAQLLTPTELEDFPFDIIWSGEDIKFEANSVKATELSKSHIFSSVTVHASRSDQFTKTKTSTLPGIDTHDKF